MKVTEKEEAEDIIIPETTTETQETTPETTIEEEVFEEIVNALGIEGLKFDQATKTYICRSREPLWFRRRRSSWGLCQRGDFEGA